MWLGSIGNMLSIDNYKHTFYAAVLLNLTAEHHPEGTLDGSLLLLRQLITFYCWFRFWFFVRFEKGKVLTKLTQAGWQTIYYITTT